MARLLVVVGVGVVLAFGLAALVQGGFGLTSFIDAISYLAFAAPVATFVVMFRSRKVTAHERTRLRAYIPLFVAAMIFWMIFEQAASTLASYAQDNTDLVIFGVDHLARAVPVGQPGRRSSCWRRCSRGCGSSSTTARRPP